MLSLIVLLGFPFLIWQAYRKVRLSRESATWPQVRGIITASERVKAMWRVQPRVSYGYEVDGKTYASSRVTFADAVPASETEPILARYLLHQAVAVSYQPGHPEVAVLEPGPNRAVSLGLRAFIIWYGIIILLNVADIGITLWTSGPDAGTSTAPTYDDVAKADPQLGNKAADQGNAEGESWLGQLYAKGVGVDKDLVQAVAWMRKAADQGEPHACASLGYAYEKGVGGLPQDKEQAIEWYRKAGDEPHAKKALARLQAGG
jgi:hypothetical protein